jgi:hypothetical protein
VTCSTLQDSGTKVDLVKEVRFVPLCSVFLALFWRHFFLVKEHAVAVIEKRYKSPIHKLLPFFERSRNGWKEKCGAAKAVIKRLKNQTEKLQRSRQRWKELAKERGREVERLRHELETQKL